MWGFSYFPVFGFCQTFDMLFSINITQFLLQFVQVLTSLDVGHAILILFFYLFITFFLYFQLSSNAVLLFCANVIGLYHKYLTDITHRHTFLEARKSIKSMVELEQEKKEQVRKNCFDTRSVTPRISHSSILWNQTKIRERSKTWIT